MSHQLDSKEIWNKVVNLIKKNNLTVTPITLNVYLHSLLNDKRRNLGKHREFLEVVAEKCHKNKIKSYIRFKALF